MDTGFTPQWIDALLEQYEYEVKEESEWPVLILSSPVRSRVWSMCAGLGVESRGVPGSACRILERYLCRDVQEFLKDSPDDEEWVQYKRMLESRFFLIIASCVMLAAKMNSAHAPVAVFLIQRIMLAHGVEYRSKADIIATELSVYQTLDFRVPLWTNTEISQFLAIQVGMQNDKFIEVVGKVTNYVEYNRNCLENHLKSWVEDPRSPSLQPNGPAKCTIHNLHLSAAVVTASARYMRLANDPTKDLARLTRSTALYINTIAHIILKYMLSRHALFKLKHYRT